MTDENENAPMNAGMPISLRDVRIKNAEAGVANVIAYLERALYGRRPMKERGGSLRARVQAYIALLNEGLEALDAAEAEREAAIKTAGTR